jgi:3-deoxy-D-manno-octulosonic-acid transferase
MRRLYTLLWLVLLPLAFVYLAWRAPRQPEYLRHWRERLGGAPRPASPAPTLWIHAVSVGETRACAPLLHALRQRLPGARLLLTHGTPTGRATGRALFGDSVCQAYLPYDLPWLCARFLERQRPVLGIVMETEVWPNMYQACAARGVPLYLANARLSARSAAGYARVPGLTRQAFACLAGILAQTEADAQRFRDLGAARVAVTGNLKFDGAKAGNGNEVADALRRRVGGRFVWLAASTREGEEAIVLDAWRRLGRDDILLAVVPRHPQRFDEVARLLRAADPALIRRSESKPAAPTTRILLGDSMGEMAAYYDFCDIAFIGGSLVPLGGQNLIEAAAAGKPVLIGPHTFNFEDVARQAVAAGAARRVAHAEELAEAVRRLRDAPEERLRMAQAGIAFARAHRGATARMLDAMEPALRRFT